MRLLKWFLPIGILLGIGAIVGVIKKYPQIKGRDIPPLERRMHRPSAVPDRIVLSWKSDPATSQAVTWRTDVDVDGAVAQIGPASAAPGRGELVGFSDSTRSVNAVSTRLETDLDAALYHAAEFTGLTPSTRYAYRVGDGVHWSEWFHFRTAAATAEPFSFIYLGDAQNDLKSFWSSAIRAAYVQDSAARFIIHAGDLVEHGKWDAEWGEWFYAAGWINGMVPSVPMPGNHEYVEYGIYNRVLDRGSLTRHWRPLFTLPEHGPPGLEETVYYFDYQGVRFVVLNSNERLDDQVPWLERVLAENPHPWSILTFHHPVYSGALGRDNKRLRQTWMPIIDRYKVDLVLQGHDHSYSRSGNLRSGVKVRNDESGTVYVVSVSGPKMYPITGNPLVERFAEDIQLYQTVHIAGRRLEFCAYTITGELYDAFDLEKGPEGINRLVVKVPPGLPERRR